jgi:hypothetical protein
MNHLTKLAQRAKPSTADGTPGNLGTLFLRSLLQKRLSIRQAEFSSIASNQTMLGGTNRRQ